MKPGYVVESGSTQGDPVEVAWRPSAEAARRYVDEQVQQGRWVRVFALAEVFWLRGSDMRRLDEDWRVALEQLVGEQQMVKEAVTVVLTQPEKHAEPKGTTGTRTRKPRRRLR